jgi:hypothetical protein
MGEWNWMSSSFVVMHGRFGVVAVHDKALGQAILQ